jgi:hypothetical protein
MKLGNLFAEETQKDFSPNIQTFKQK